MDYLQIDHVLVRHCETVTTLPGGETIHLHRFHTGGEIAKSSFNRMTPRNDSYLLFSNDLEQGGNVCHV